METRNANLYCIIGGAVLLIVGLLAWVGQDQFDGMALWGWVALGLGALSLAFGLWESRHGLRGGMRRRSTRIGLQVGVMIVLVVGIIVVVELVSINHYKRWDLTQGNYFSLSPKTLRILEKLDKENRRVEIISFTQKTDRAAIKAVLEQYTQRTEMIKFRFVDLDASPRTAKKYDVDAYGTIVVVHHLDENEKKSSAAKAKAGETEGEKKEGEKKKTFRSEKFFDLSENSIANAILKTIQSEQKRVYFLTGHGERLHIGRGRELLAVLATGMRDDNYKVDELLLLRKKRVPKDTNILIIAAPKKDIEEVEAGFIEDYLKRGGRLLVLLEPDTPEGRLTALLKKFGVEAPASASFVIDPQAVQFALAGGNQLTPFVLQYGIHEITKQMRGMATMFPTVRRVSAISNPKAGISVEVLAKTGKGSFTVAGIELKDDKATYDPKTKKDGPVPLGVAITVNLKAYLKSSNSGGAGGEKGEKAEKQSGENGAKEARIVVFGDADFASDAFIGSQGNANLAFNTVNWLGGEKALVTIRPKSRVADPLILTGGQSGAVRMFTVWIMPLFVILAGAAVYVRRRQLR